LGVAGTDIPIKELKKIASPFKLGVNGYAYMINNNGYVVFHPDWRPVFRQELLKPNYNTVDLTEVELVDNDHTTKNNDSELIDVSRTGLLFSFSYFKDENAVAECIID
jgi:voltage-dependent calcium channel alpha-2/delta-3